MTRFTGKNGPKLMILYASYGDGHLQAARAIRDALADRDVEQTVLIDLLAEAHPWINEMTRRVYMKSFTLLPGLYGWVYDRTKPMKHDSLFASWLHSFGRDRLRRILLSEQPDAVIHTFPFLAMPAMKQRIGLRIPSCTVVTDFDLHRRWVHPNIDRFYVPTEDMKRELETLGISSGRVCVSGIPLKRGFRSVSDNRELRERYGLPAGKPVVLIMAGAQGVLPDMNAIVAAFLDKPSFNVAVVCGRNEALAETIRDHFRDHAQAERLHIFGYMDHIHELMALSACLVTKSGGVTLAEALAAGLPIFVYRPVPGQERNNAIYLANKGAAFITRSPQQLADDVAHFINDPIRLMNSKKALLELGRLNAADTIALDFCAGLNIMEEAPAANRS